MKTKILQQYPNSIVTKLFHRTYITTEDNRGFSCDNNSSICYYHGVYGSGNVDVTGVRVNKRLLEQLATENDLVKKDKNYET